MAGAYGRSLLPGDVVDYVFGYLDVVDLVRSTRVCVLWRERGVALRIECLGVVRDEMWKWAWVKKVMQQKCKGKSKQLVTSLVGTQGVGATSLFSIIKPHSESAATVVDKSTQRAGYRGHSLHLLCYDTSAQGGFFQFLAAFYRFASEPRGSCVLVGTKCDLPPDPLTTDLANILSHILSIPHVRTSAKTGEGIEKLEETIATTKLRRSGKGKKRCCLQ